jgi:hypothetical protein
MVGCHEGNFKIITRFGNFVEQKTTTIVDTPVPFVDLMEA